MMAQGFLEEVQHLLDMGYDRTLPSMSGLGYDQLAAHLQGECSLEEAVQTTRTATHDFIRRQITWFRGHNGGIQWLDAEQTEAAGVIAGTARWLETI